ncbi:MAG: PAS domain-containing sensor histidine kinase [Chloroflexota bacterium]|jgi:PAS domain S-box-containing protein
MTAALRRLGLPLAAAVFLSLYAAWLLWGSTDAWERFWVGNLAILLTGASAAWLAGWLSTTVPPRQRSALRRLFAGLALWAFNDLLRMVLLALDPALLLRPNLCDLLFLPGALLIGWGLVCLPRPARSSGSRLRRWLDITLTSLAALALIYLLVLQPRLAEAPGIGNPLGILYPLGNLALLLLLANLFLLDDAHRRLDGYAWLTAALAVFTLTDLLYATALRLGNYQIGSAADLGWAVGDTLVLSALLKPPFSPAAQRSQELARPARRIFQGGLARFQSLLPVLAVLVLGWYTLLDWQLRGVFNQPVLWVTVLLALGLIARQGVVTGEVEYEQYASLVNSVAEPAFVCDERGRLNLVNPALAAACGYSQAELLNRPLEDVLDQPPEGSRWLNLAREGGVDNLAGWSGETALRRQDGSLLPVFLSLRPVVSATRRRLTVAGTAHDLSLQKRQQAALQAAYERIAADRAELERLNRELEQRVAEKTADLSEAYRRLEAQNRLLLELDRLKSDFVSLVSHELRAPLTNIKSGIELLMHGTRPLSGRSSQILYLVQAEIERLTRFVETILDISALEAGKLPLYPAPLPLTRAQTSLNNQIAHLSSAQRVRWDIPPDLPAALVDEQALNSILFHLLDNAFKYAPEGEIEVSAGLEGARIWLRVRDHGRGLPPEALPHLFEQFYRHDREDNRAVYGHGLGLYIVRRLLEAMRGDIRAENHPLGGAQFTCWLPLAEVSEADFAARQEVDPL